MSFSSLRLRPQVSGLTVASMPCASNPPRLSSFTLAVKTELDYCTVEHFERETILSDPWRGYLVRTAMHSEKGKGENLRAMLEAGMDVHFQNELPLQRAAENGHADSVQVLIDAGADANARDGGVLLEASGMPCVLSHLPGPCSPSPLFFLFSSPSAGSLFVLSFPVSFSGRLLFMSAPRILPPRILHVRERSEFLAREFLPLPHP